MESLGVHSSPGVPPVGAACVLYVCEGGICRSPAAEVLLRHLLPLPSLEVLSAGTHALAAEAMSPEMVRLLAERGVDGSGAYSRQLTEEMVEKADLIVTMTSLQRRHVVLMSPAALQRTWTLLSLSASLLDVPPAGPDQPRSLRSLSLRAAAHRSTGGGDVPDPYRRGRRTYARVLDLIVPAVATVAEATHRELLQARMADAAR